MAISSNSQPILFIFLEIFAQEGGIQSYIKDILREYINLQDVPHADIFLLRDGKDCENSFEKPNFRFHYFRSPSPAIGRIFFSLALLVYILQKRPQHIFCGHVRLAQITHFLCHRFKIPYTVITYGKEIWTKLPEGERNALEKAEQIWTISRYTRNQACQANQLNPLKFRLLPCVVDGEYFTPGDKSCELIQKYHLENSRVLLTVARLWSGDIYKGVDVTIRALPKILVCHPNVKYLVIGRGDDQPRLARLAEEFGVNQHVIFAGFVPTDQLVKHYRLADGYVMPSQEGFGIVYLEAMSCGIPVIAGDNDGSADPLQDGRVGWQVPHRNPDAVAQACIELLDGHDRRCHSQWLREQTLAVFSRPALSSKLKTLLKTTFS